MSNPWFPVLYYGSNRFEVLNHPTLIRVSIYMYTCKTWTKMTVRPAELAYTLVSGPPTDTLTYTLTHTHTY